MCASTNAETETGCDGESIRDDDRCTPAQATAARGVFAGRLRGAADAAIAPDGPDGGAPDSAIRAAMTPPGGARAQPPPASLRDLIDRPERRPMVWVHHPVSGARLFRLPAELPEHWRASGEAGAGAPAALPPLTAETVLHEIARIAFTDPLPAGRTSVPRTGTSLAVTLRDKQTALAHLGRHLGLFCGRSRTHTPHETQPDGSRPYAELSDHDLKAKSDDVIRALAGMGVEVRIAEDDARAANGDPSAA